MNNDLTTLDKAEWKKTRYLKIHANGPVEEHPYEYVLELPEPLASLDVFDYWEVERTHSMRDNLKKGDILFDCGSENGWLSAIYAQFVGAENMVLIEPSLSYWATIRAIFEHNNLPTPKACWTGLVGSENKGDGSSLTVGSWPEASNSNELHTELVYKYIHEHGETTDQITIDELVRVTGIIPTAITADLEGAEIRLVQGSQKTLKKYHPKVWLSLHSDLALRDGYGDIQQVHDLMKELGYPEGEYLGTNHEAHWYWCV